jgi:hypothetical protein
VQLGCLGLQELRAHWVPQPLPRLVEAHLADHPRLVAQIPIPCGDCNMCQLIDQTCCIVATANHVGQLC